MTHRAPLLKPILAELDGICPLDQPVLIDAHLLPLFLKHSGRETIDLIPVPSLEVRGIHLGSKNKKHAVVVYQRCEIHHGKQAERDCPGCQEARFSQAKELVHCLDTDGDMTPPDHTANDLLDQLVRSAWRESQQVMADGWGEPWGLELLVRYRHRLLVHGGGKSTPSLQLSTARVTENYSYLAAQYGVPPAIIKRAFKDEYMALMKGIREANGLSCAIPDLTYASA